MTFDFPLFLSLSGLYVALATITSLFLVLYNPRLVLQDYPQAIQELVPPQTDLEKRQSIWLGLPFILVLIVFPVYATFAFLARTGGEAGFLSLWLFAFGISFAFQLWDWLILDWLVFCTITPKGFVIPGSEGHPAYKDYFYHFRGFLIGTLFSVGMGLITAGGSSYLRIKDTISMNTFDLMFVLSAVAFNLLIAAIFVAQKLGREKLVRTFGIVWLWLIVPLALVFVSYWQAGRETKILVSFGLVFFYMLVELLLDHVFKVDFRSKAITHVPYIILEYIALFSLIAIAYNIDQRWGWVISICFWILMGSLVYLYWDKIFKKR